MRTISLALAAHHSINASQVYAFQNVYPAAETATKKSPSLRLGLRGAVLCFDFVTTAILAQGEISLQPIECREAAGD